MNAPAHATAALLRTDQPYLAFARAVALLMPASPPPRHRRDERDRARRETRRRCVDRRVRHRSAPAPSIGARTIVYPNVTIGAGARIGEDCVIHSQVSIRDGIVIGHRVIVQDGSVIGSEGFGFAQAGRRHALARFRSAPTSSIEDDVEIGANTTIDRPAIGETRIGAGTKIDNLVQVGHGVTIGRRVLLAAQVGIAGSCVIEDDVVLGGAGGRRQPRAPGQGRVIATAQTGIPNSVDAGEYVSGYPAISHREWLQVGSRLPSAACAEEARCGPRATPGGASRRSSLNDRVRRIFLPARGAGSRASRSSSLPHPHAQEALKTPPPASMDFLTASDFHLSAAGLSSEDHAFLLGHALGRRLRLPGLCDRSVLVPRRLRGGSRQGKPPLRSESGQLHARGLRLGADQAVRAVGVLHHVSRHL